MLRLSPKAMLWKSRCSMIQAFDPDVSVPRKVQEAKFAGFAQSFEWFLWALGSAPKKDWVVLEAGHGSTGYARFYRKLFDQVYGADIEDYSDFHPGVTSIVADLTVDLPLPANSVDMIVSHSVLEHVKDVPAALATLDQVLKPRGLVYITIFPLYYSAEGAHVRTPTLRYDNWEHLDPDSPLYLTEVSPNTKDPTAGHLNQYRFADFLRAIGTVPWDILHASRAYDPRPIPDFVDTRRYSESDLRTRGFKLLACKTWPTASGT